MRHPSVSIASISSEKSHIQVLKTAISSMDTEIANQGEKLEINLPAPEPKAMTRDNRKPKPVTKLFIVAFQQTQRT